MRSLHTLLTLLHKRVAGYPVVAGMCKCISELHGLGVITFSESNYMLDYIVRNKPATGKRFNVVWYPRGEKTRRLEWIEHHLQINKKR